MQKKILYTTIFIIFWDCLMFYLFFLSPQEQRSAIITYKHDIYEFQQELVNVLRLRILANDEILAKFLNFMDWWPSA